MTDVQFGVDTFGDRQQRDDGELETHAQTIRNVIEEGVLADEVGIDAFGVGEHHRDDFAISSPELVLAAVAARTSRITLGTAVTVLSSDDPVRIFERFATLDAISNGRAEVTLGRGSFTESYPLFGYQLQDYDVLFEEKVELFVELLKEAPVTWSGAMRAPLHAADVYPKSEGMQLRGTPIRTSIGVGGSPDSVVRAARYRLPLTLAIIGGDPARFAPYADLYRRALAQLGSEPLPITAHSPGFVAATDHDAKEVFWPHYVKNITRIGRERGWPPPSRAQFEHEVAEGALHVGSPETVARKIARTVSVLGLSRFDLKYSAGTLPHSDAMSAIRRYGTEVIPRVRELLAGGAGSNAAPAQERAS